MSAFIAFVLGIFLSLIFGGPFIALALITFVVGVVATVRRQTVVGVTMIVCGILALPLAVALTAFALKPYRVPSESMVPTLEVGDVVVVNRLATPSVGDIVVFHPPAGAEAARCGVSHSPDQVCPRPVHEKDDVIFIKRVVAGPGDTIAVVHGHVVLNGKNEEEPFAARCAPGGGCNFPVPIKVPAGEYFLLGDNRGSSDDSRYWGPVPGDWIIGKPFLVSRPFGHFRFL